MDTLRKPLLGVWNILRFNRHFYLSALIIVFILGLLSIIVDNPYNTAIRFTTFILITPVCVSLLVSIYVYDLSNLYKLECLNSLPFEPGSKVININAGFDECSYLLKYKFPLVNLKVYDFYDPEKHTEISIKRARKAYPAFGGTIQITTSYLPEKDESVDYILVIFSAHEIRDEAERIIFFTELNRVLKNSGKVVIIEHKRDVMNFLAYNIGFFHFLSTICWNRTFKNAGFKIHEEKKTTPFITNFILEKNGAEY